MADTGNGATAVAWRWQALDWGDYWIYDPSDEWREYHKDDEKLIFQALYALPDAEGGEQVSPVSMLVSFLDQHLLDTLVVPKAFKPGPNQASAALLEPRRSLLVRHELMDHRIYIEEQTLKKWLVKVGVNTEGFYRDLKDKGILGGVCRKTLGAGTAHSTGQVTALEIIANHPMMSGHVASVETIVAPSVRRA